jgi:tRNA-dihydrouridine synthase 3
LNGVKSEWALLRRHPSEDIFGVQIAGCNPQLLTETVEALSLTCPDIDFIDLNMGCPVDLVTKHGAGSSLLERKNRTEEILMGMNFASSIAHTVKIRTGITSKNVAHNLLDMFKRNNVSLVTLHGRSKEQRYTKLADWNYISECASQLKDSSTSFFGNGDILSWEDYYSRLESVDGVMIGRGALIKPWIFKEIKSRQVYDISSRERLDILRDFANFGLEHWGSDTLGVNSTRRFMCEWLSFLCRYIPVGLLEVLPQKMNERPPPFKGRDDLETLMASNNSQDWIKITELFLGPAPESFEFVPKHKSNSYSTENGNE